MNVNNKQFKEACDILRDSIRIEEYLVKEGRVNFDLKGHTGMIRCPLPDHDDSTPSFSYDDEKQLFNCFGCGRGGDIVNLHYYFHKIENDRYTRTRAVRELAKLFKVTIPDLYKETMNTGRVQKYKHTKVDLNNLRDEIFREKVRGYEERIKTLRDTKKRIKIYLLIDDMYLGNMEAKEVMNKIREELQG